MKRTLTVALAVLFSAALVAEAVQVDLYGANEWQGGGPGSGTRAQRFSASESLPAGNRLTDNFDAVAMKFNTMAGANGPGHLTGTLGLYPWMGDFNSSIGAGAIGSVPVDIAPSTPQVTIWISGFAPQDYKKSYLVSLNYTSTNDFSVYRIANNVGGTNNDAYNNGSIKTDREYAVYLNQVPEPTSLALLALGSFGLLRRRR